MRNIIYYLLDIEPDTNAISYFLEMRNKSISIEKGLFQFKPKNWKNNIKIDFGYNLISCNESLTKTSQTILEKAFKEAIKISDENMDLKSSEKLFKGITLVINKYCYFDKSSGKTFFDLATDIFCKILMGHYLLNGNKRMALTFLKGFLWEFGYYLKWTQGMYKNCKKHRTQVEIFVKKLEKKSGNNYERTRNQIHKWIKKNTIIGLNWRKNAN